ncbi:ATP-binding protein [Streptomyces erythrochromogenes]|uniref:ATP-binding protein n=1 Tax=Streptomyces erythrochromogenes TaxID=285574 RepID=UPI00369998E0
MTPTPLTGTGPTRCADSDFEIRFASTPRGARLSRRLASHCLHSWGHPYGSETTSSVSLVVAELAANAVTHGRVPGRDVLLRLVRSDGLVRIEVSDTRGERAPAVRAAGDGEEAGRGLVIVCALAEMWGMAARPGASGKTVWAVLREGGRPAPT